VWTSTSARKFGLGPYIIADGLIYVMNDSGLLTLAEATPTGYVQLAQAKVLEGPDAWGPMAIVGGRLILRDMNRMICLDVAER
jgi:outer membrane protein assembly factor BamB